MKKYAPYILGIVALIVLVAGANFSKNQPVGGPAISNAQNIIVSNVNSSATTLSDGGTFTGTKEYNDKSDVMVSVKTDVPGTLYMDFSHDGTNWDSSLSFDVAGSTNEIHTLIKGERYYRTRFVDDNDSLTQSYFRLQTEFGDYDKLTSRADGTLNTDTDALATIGIDELSIMKEKVSGQRIISKFGENPDVDTAEDIWDGGGDYTGFPTATADEFVIVSTDANDAAGDTGARTVQCFYLNDDYEMFDDETDADGDGDTTDDYLDFTLSLNGISGATTTVSGMRIWRCKVATSGSSQINEGTLTVRWADTPSVVFQQIQAGSGQTKNTAFTVPAGYTGYLKRYHSSMTDNTTNDAEMEIVVHEFGSNTFLETRDHVITTTFNSNISLFGGATYSEKTDIIFRAGEITNANGYITVDYGILLVKN